MAQSGSLLDALGQSILDSASSIDAHIDAGALVDRISGDCSTASGHRARQFALAEFKALAKRAPGAVVATEGAVVAILRVVEKISPPQDEELADENVESMQDALECLSSLMSTGSSKSSASKDSKIEEKERADEQRGQLVAELIVKHTENVKQLLRLLCLSETSTQYDAMILLQKIYIRLPEPVNAAILADPRSLGHLMHVLQTSPIDYVRNECLSLLLLLTAANADIQTIVTVQGFIETVFSILEDEDLALGGKVARDLLQCLMNIVGNSTCQKYLRETDGAASLVSAISVAVAGRPSEEDDEEDERPEIPGESRWACLSLLVDAALSLASPPDAAEAEAEANRLALVKAGALDLCRHLSDPQLAEAAQLMLVRLFQSLEKCPQAADRLQSFGRGKQDSGRPLLFDLAAVLLGPVTRLSLRNALGRVLCRCVARHASLQSFLCSSLSPELQADSPEVRPAGRLLVDMLEAACLSGGGGSASVEVSWFALSLLLAMMRGNASVQSACTTMPVLIPSDAGPAKTFQELLFAAFSATVRKSLASHDQEAEDLMSGPSHEVSTLLGFLKLLLYWLATCPSVLGSFATSPVMIPLAIDLTCLDGRCGPFCRTQIEGLACLVMGACIKAEHTEADVTALMSLIARRVGIEAYQHKVESLWRSEALQRPPRGLAEFRCYNGHYRIFVREQQRAVQRRMVQLYVAEGSGGGGLSEDVAEHYKQLIRVQACAIFDGGLGKFDIAAICHEVGLFAESGRRVVEILFRTSQAEDGVLVLKVWATRDTPPFSKHAEKRPVGEVRIPLRHLSDLCNCMLYFTWVNLESAGLNDSVAHLGTDRDRPLGYGNPFAMNSSESFLQASLPLSHERRSQGIMSNPRQLFQPKACISICRADELAETDRLLWQDRIKRWGPLLRSQQQHAVMCTAQNLEAQDQANDERHLSSAQADEQAQEIDLLQEQLQQRPPKCCGGDLATCQRPRNADRSRAGEAQLFESMTRQFEAKTRQIHSGHQFVSGTESGFVHWEELELQQSLSAQLRGELQSYEVELSKLGEEANNKIEAANIRIRALRRERDEAILCGAPVTLCSTAVEDDFDDACCWLLLVRKELEDEKSQLAQQKETLMRMVEDLHACCNEDADLREVRHENEQLRSEVEAFMKRTLKASSAALADKAALREGELHCLHGLPAATSLTYQGVFNEHSFYTGGPETNETLSVAAHAMCGLSGHPNEVWVGCFLKSCRDGQPRDSVPVDMVVVLDVSGSMSLAVSGGDRSSSRLDLAKDALLALVERLRGDDRFGLATFTREGHIVQPLTYVSELTDLDARVAAMTPGGGTTLAAGMEAAIKISGEADGSRHRRLLFLTDMDDLNPDQLDYLVASQADRGLYVSFVGIGAQFNSSLAEVVTKHRGANYFCMTRQEELHKIAVSNFDWNFFPAAFDVQVTQQSDVFELLAVYGTALDPREETIEAEWTPSTHRYYPAGFKQTVQALMLCIQRISGVALPMPAFQKILSFLDAGVRSVVRIDTVFPSGISEDGSVEGGLILLRLKPQKAHCSSWTTGRIRVITRYEADGKDCATCQDLTVSDGLNENTSLGRAVRKGVMLQRYVEACRQYLLLSEPALERVGCEEYLAKLGSALSDLRALQAELELHKEFADEMCSGLRSQLATFLGMAERHASKAGVPQEEQPELQLADQPVLEKPQDHR
ncbi:Uso1 [Symbiodinium sp. KB8]|nr:Uso1 [Symbiodinium sp. KB8]